MKFIDNDWTDLGYLIGFSIGMAITYHKSHWITVGATIILTILMFRRQQKDRKSGGKK